MTGQQLGSMTTVGIGAVDRPILLVPLGSTEQHGPHLPLDTDTRIATAWSHGLAERIEAAVVAPALPYGSSGEHQGFAGTLSIGQAALETVLVELIRSASGTFAGVVLVCGHGGNAAPLRRVVTAMEAEGHRVLALLPRWDPDELGVTIDAHAGRTETSLVMQLAPDLVDLGLAEAGTTTPLAELVDELRLRGVAAVSPNGVLGDPAGADASEGRLLLEALVAGSIDDVRALRSGR